LKFIKFKLSKNNTTRTESPPKTPARTARSVSPSTSQKRAVRKPEPSLHVALNVDAAVTATDRARQIADEVDRKRQNSKDAATNERRRDEVMAMRARALRGLEEQRKAEGAQSPPLPRENVRADVLRDSDRTRANLRAPEERRVLEEHVRPEQPHFDADPSRAAMTEILRSSQEALKLARQLHQQVEQSHQVASKATILASDQDRPLQIVGKAVARIAQEAQAAAEAADLARQQVTAVKALVEKSRILGHEALVQKVVSIVQEIAVEVRALLAKSGELQRMEENVRGIYQSRGGKEDG